MRIFLTITSLLLGCSNVSTTQSQTLTIEMYANDETPEGAEGDATPTWEKFTLTGVSFLSEDGSEVTNLFGAEVDKEFKIINRAQIIFRKDVEDLVEVPFSAITVNFDPEVTAASLDNEEATFTLEEPNQILRENFTIEPGKSVVLTVLLHWKNTASADGVTNPGFDLIRE